MAHHPPFDITRHLTALRRYARALTRDSNAVDDLVQGSVLRAYEQQDKFRTDMNSRGWLMTIMHNLFIDTRRADRATALREGQAAQLAPQTEPARQEGHMRLLQIRAAFLQLPDEQREALTLVAVEGMTCQQAAQRLQIPMGTLLSRIGRARAALRDIENGRRLP